MTPSIIEFDQVNKIYKTDLRRKTIALTNLSFQVKKNEVFGIVGPNGAGKSTALKILMGFVRQDSGKVDVNGCLPSDPRAHRQIGFLPENPCLYEHLTIIDHLKFANRVTGNSLDFSRKSKNLLELVDLAGAANIPIRRFSKGMTQRAALACALFHEPEILVLDEPMSGLDPLGRQLVIDLIQDYNRKGHTILFCSHILTDVERICDRIGIMCKGKLAKEIRPQELKRYNDPDHDGSEIKTPLESFFLQTIQEHNHE